MKEQHWEGYRAICAYLEDGIQGFKEVHIIKHVSNLGPAENYRKLREEIYKVHDAYIYMEDDNEVSQNYLEYMNKCMNYYWDDEKVIAVSGYMYPISTSQTQGNYIFLDTYYSCFGHGVYRRSDELFDRNITMSNFVKIYRDRKEMKRLRKASPNQYGNFVKGMLQYTGDELIREGEIRKLDLTYGLYMFFQEYKMVFPVISKVRNHGFDGSGENCGVQEQKGKDNYREYDFAKQDIDLSESFEPQYIESDMKMINWNARLSRFFVVPRREAVRTTAAYYLSLIIGIKTATKLIRQIRK